MMKDILKKKLAKASQINILFVCTGNTCRSPMAEGICKRILSEKLNCPLDRLEEIGYKISSAGIYAACGAGVSVEAVEALQAMGIDISSHISRLLTEKAVNQADVVFVLAESHLEYIVNNWPDVKSKIVMLDDTDIQDPIGLSLDVYTACAKQIKDAVLRRIGECLK